MIPASFQAGMYRPGFPAPVVTTETPSSKMTRAMSSAQGFMSIRFTPKGFSVSARARRISLRTRSASQAPVAIIPKAPALEQAAANSPVAMFAMPPWIMGNSVPSSSFNFFTLVLSSRKLNQAPAPGQAAAEAHGQDPASGADPALFPHLPEARKPLPPPSARSFSAPGPCTRAPPPRRT